MILGEFLRNEAASNAPHHCSTLPADWCIALGHPDYAAAWRNVSEGAEADAVVAAAGGLVPLWQIGIGSALPVVDSLEAGDIAVVAANVFGLPFDVGAIFTGERWAVRAPKGLHLLSRERVTVLAAWRPT